MSYGIIIKKISHYNDLFVFSLQSLNSKQRQLRKSNHELAPNDAAELGRVSAEQAVLQKHLEAARKQLRQHGMLCQVTKPTNFYVKTNKLVIKLV